MTSPLPDNIPYGFCHCGCGEKTNIALKTNNKLNHKAGEPVPYRMGHWARVRSAQRKQPGWEIVLDGVPCMALPLSQGQFAIVDQKNYVRLSAHKWSALWSENTHSFYASRSITLSDGRKTTTLMHRDVKRIGLGDPTELDHWNGNTLDNRESNIRDADWSQNMCNRKCPTNNTSGVKGVSFYKRTGQWQSYLMIRGQRVHKAVHKTLDAAITARLAAEIEHHGRFALASRPIVAALAAHGLT